MIFMLINMNIGGIEKALLNMVNEMSKDQYDITIFMLEKYGGFFQQIPSHVNIEYFNGYHHIKGLLNKPPQMMSLQLLKQGKIFKALIILSLHIITKLLKDRSLYFQFLLRNYPMTKNEYDIAVAYDGPMDFISYFVLKKIKAKKKIQWIHFDVTKIGFNQKFASKIYVQFDNIFVVSKEARRILIELVPKIEKKTDIFFNMASPEMIKSQSKIGSGFKDSFNGLRILTVGRLAAEKGQDLAIRVLARLIKNGFKVKWYCLGDGSLKEAYESQIKEFNLQDQFILLGADPNPYPYMEQCDIYVQPSRHEGYCITLMEARYLTKPILTTEFTGAREQIRDGENGLVVRINEEELYQGLVKLINNADLRNEFTKKLAAENSNNPGKMNNIFDYVG